MSTRPGAATIDLNRECLLRGDREIRLRAKTFHVLVYLFEHHGQLVTKEDLFRAVWLDTFVSDDSLTKCVREIREALEDRDHQLLKTVARRGFILDAPLAPLPQAGVRRASVPNEPPRRASHNLPAALTSFIGRQRQVAEIVKLLPSTRLLTLTGAGGCGKTRLAIEVARQVLDDFPDGVWLADLAPLTEPALVTQTVASIFDVRQTSNRSLIETLMDQLRDRHTLLLLDNCEHLVASSADLADTLLRKAPNLTILATSREALGMTGEHVWRVPSLTLPDSPHVSADDDLLKYEAIHLLVERAKAVDPTFAITNENADTVAEVCRRLDGIPLAIELAATRLNVLSIEQINARLDDRFRLLARTHRTPIGRQQTLEATVDWSYDLLSEEERLLLRRLSVFAGGWTLEAAEQVCSGDGIESADVLDLMSRLVDKSLVVVDHHANGRRRYRSLETVRQYASNRLRNAGDADAVRVRHFALFLDVVTRAEPELMKSDQLQWLDRLQVEQDNLRAAMEWRLAADPPGPEGLELAARLHWFWIKRAQLAEGRQWLERGLARFTAAPIQQRAQAMTALGNILFFLGDFERAHALLGEGAAIAEAAGTHAIAAIAFGMFSMTSIERGDFDGAAQSAARSAAAARAATEPWLEGFSLSYRGYEALYAGEIDRAGDLYEQGLTLLRAQGEIWGMTIALFDLALLRVVQQRHAEARAMCHEAIAIGRQFGDQRAIAWALGLLAGADAAEGHAVRAARLRGAMDGLLDSIGTTVQPTYNLLIDDRLFPAVRTELGTDAYQQAWASGRAMSLSQAIEYAAEAQEQR